MTVHRPCVALILSTLALAASGCGCGGGDAASDDAQGGNGDNSLASADVAVVLDARRQIDAACGSNGSGTPDRPTAELSGAVSSLAGVARQYPERIYESGNEDRAVEMRQVAGEVAEQLRRCGVQAEADRLAQL